MKTNKSHVLTIYFKLELVITYLKEYCGRINHNYFIESKKKSAQFYQHNVYDIDSINGMIFEIVTQLFSTIDEKFIFNIDMKK